jgi:hypothetical protein
METLEKFASLVWRDRMETNRRRTQKERQNGKQLQKNSERERKWKLIAEELRKRDRMKTNGRRTQKERQNEKKCRRTQKERPNGN